MALQSLYWLNAPGYLLVPALVGVAVFTYVSSIWPLGMIVIYALMEASVGSGMSPFSGTANDATLLPVRLGVAIVAGIWFAVAYSPSQIKNSIRPFEVPNFEVLRGARWPLAIVAVATDAYRFRNTGVPLFASNVDALRGVLREESSLVVGLLREAWTLGALIAILLVFISPRWKMTDIAWAAFFSVGAFSGGSRNALLIAVVPAIFAVVIFLRAKRGASASEPALRKRKAATWIGLIAVALAGIGSALSLMLYAGQRVLKGTGQFERDFQAMYEGNPWGAAFGMTNLTLSAPLETWSRLFLSEANTHHDLQLNIFASVAFLLRPFGMAPDLYEVTSALSAPYYMTVGTFMAAPMRDFGVWGALLTAVVLGASFGFIDKALQRKRNVFALAGRGFLIYIAYFSVYEFQPFLYLSWVPTVIGLVCLSKLKDSPVRLAIRALRSALPESSRVGWNRTRAKSRTSTQDEEGLPPAG